MESEIVEYGLPAGALLIYRVRGLCIKRNTHVHALGPGVNSTSALRSPNAYSIRFWSTIFV